uniref:CASP-like protein PHYPADRAFT_66946 n=1 Tax=Anthurium amnicola TaxID=1678845 RepID=A0A1D1YRX3_9ARAE
MWETKPPMRSSIFPHISVPMASASASPTLLLLFALCFVLNNGVGECRKLAKGPMHEARNHTRIRPACVLNNEVQHTAQCYSPRSIYYGAKAKMSVHVLPTVQTAHVSSTLIEVLNDESDGTQKQLNMIRAGWQVSPDLYGDTQTRLFTYWTTDHNQTTGCYDVQCSGFIIESGTSIRPGSILSEWSSYGGDQTYITLTISKDPSSGHWWLVYEDAETRDTVGYWPNSLFTSLSKRATKIGYGGLVIFPKDSNGPPMGSGHLSNEGVDKAAHLRNLQFMDSSQTFQDYVHHSVKVDAPECYDVSSPSNTGDEAGVHFYFGGPKGCTNKR